MTTWSVDEHAAWLIAELRTDQAGEAGAVQIYRGIIAVSRNRSVLEFAHRHMATESCHLEDIDSVLPLSQRSHLLPIWRWLGWITGAIPALFGPTAVFATIHAVETFVDKHYQAQIDRLRSEGQEPALLAMLERLRGDEIEHMNDAAFRIPVAQSIFLKAWLKLVTVGSHVAVVFARHL